MWKKERNNQRYLNYKVGYSRGLANAAVQILPIKWGHEGAQMELFQFKIFERAHAHDITWWEEPVLYLIYLKTPLGTHAVKNAIQLQE